MSKIIKLTKGQWNDDKRDDEVVCLKMGENKEFKSHFPFQIYLGSCSKRKKQSQAHAPKTTQIQMPRIISSVKVSLDQISHLNDWHLTHSNSHSSVEPITNPS
jgi:hypothetical protein